MKKRTKLGKLTLAAGVVAMGIMTTGNLMDAKADSSGNGKGGACTECWTGGVKIYCWEGGYSCTDTACMSGFC